MGEVSDSFTEKHKRFLYRKFVSRQDFKREFEILYQNRADHKNVCIASLIELERSIKEDKAKNFIQLCKVIDYLCNHFDPIIVNEFYDDFENPIRSTNIIILSCKYNSFGVFELIVSDIHKILSNLTSFLKRSILPTDVDESRHNAFYYSIKSNNNKLLNSLFTKWKKKYFSGHLEKLDEIFSNTYDELKLKNVPILMETKLNVEAKLLELRFVSTSSRTVEGNIGSLDCVVKRLGFVLEHISILVSEFLQSDELNDNFFYIAKSIIKNIHLLKQQLKFTYERLPWEEIEYCLTVFISAKTNIKSIVFFCKSVLSKNKILRYLIYFSKLLEKEKNLIKNMASFYPTKIPKIGRAEIISGIISSCPELEGLYNDYQDLRDIHSLTKIDEYVRLLLAADAKQLVGRLTILRSLQVIGEHLKNTLESPKLSETTSDLFLFSLPSSTRDIIINIRNSLSHAPSQLIQEDLSEKYYINCQNDIKKVGDVISNIIYKKQLAKIESYITTVLASNSLDEIKEIVSILSNVNPERFSDKSLKMDYNRVVKFAELLEESIPNKSKYIEHQFQELNILFNKVGTVSCDLIGFSVLKHLNSLLASYNLDCLPLITIKTIFRQVYEKLLSCNNEPDRVIRAFQHTFLIFCAASSEIELNKDELIRMLCENVIIFESRGVDCITKLKDHLKKTKQNVQNTSYSTVEQHNNTKLEHNLSDLKSLTKNIDNSELSETITSFINNSNLRAAVEMLVLEILSSLSTSKNILENNLLYLDDSSPLLIGKSLRNHLAHDNVIYAAFLSDPSIGLFLNAKKILEVNVMTLKKKIGKLVLENPKKIKDRFDYDLIAISYQRRMFMAAKEGSIDNLKHWLSKGADIHGRCSNMFTSLHYAAMGPSIEIIKFILDRNIEIESKNCNEETPLHIAVTYKQKEVVEYLLKIAGADVNAKDSNYRGPLHNAIEVGSKEIVKVLLNYKARVGNFIVTPLMYSIMHNQIDIFEMLLYYDNNADIKDGKDLISMAAEYGQIELVNFLLQRNVKVNVKNGDSTPLHSAAIRPGKIDIVNALVVKGADVNAKVIEGFTPLYNAVFSGDENIVEFLLKNGAHVNIVNKTLNYTCLYVAARDGFDKIVRLLLDHGADVNLVNFAGETPLHAAAHGGHTKIISDLLEHGTNPNAEDLDLNTPLIRAANNGSLEAIELLVKYGAFINIKNKFGVSPLETAVVNNHHHLIEYLLKCKIDVNSSDDLGHTALHFACRSGNENIIKILLTNSASIDAKDETGSTPLHTAASLGKLEAVSVLLSNKAQLNVKNYDKATPLQCAIRCQNTDVIKILLSNGACVDSDDLSIAVKSSNKDLIDILLENIGDKLESLDEVLRYGVIKASLEIVETLLRMKPDINSVDCKKYTALHHAAVRGHDGIIKSLLKQGALVNSLTSDLKTPLYLAAESGHEDVVQVLIKQGANVNTMSLENMTPLHVATLNGQYGVTKILLEKGAEVSFECEISPVEMAVEHGKLQIIKLFQQYIKLSTIITKHNDDEWTLLHLAALQGDIEIIKYLVEEGCDFNTKSVSGMKPIHIAAEEGHLAAIEYFVKIGANINDTDCTKMSVLHHASEGGHVDVVKYLIENGSKINLQDDEGWSPLHYAAKYSYRDVIQVLLAAGAAYDAEEKNHFLSPGDVALDEGVMDFFNNIEDMVLACQMPEPNSFEMIQDAIRKGVFVNAKNMEGKTGLHYAASMDGDECVKFLLENNADPNSTDNDLFTPLHYAAKHSNLEVVIVLLSKGAIYNPMSKKGKIPASLTAKKEIQNLLLLVSNTFDAVENRSNQILNDLRKIDDISTMKVLMNACNRNLQTLVTAAIKNNFRKVDALKDLFVGDVSKKIEDALQLAIQGNFQKSLNILNDIYKKRKEILGPNNPGTLDILVNIAKVVYKQGDFLEALKLNEEIFYKQKEMFGMDNEATLSTRSTQALILHRIGREDEALEIFKGILPRQMAILKPNHIDILSTQLYIGATLDKLKRFDEALFHTKAVYDFALKTNGSMNQITIAAQNNIAMILGNQGKIDECIKMYREVYVKKQRFYGATNPDTLRTLHHIAGFLAQQNKYKEGISTFQEVLTIQKNILGMNHPDTLHTMFNLSNLYLKEGKRREAIKMFKDIDNNVGNALGKDHPMYSDIKTKLESLKLVNKVSDFKVMDLIKNSQQELTQAVNEGDIITIMRLLDEGVDINDKDPEGRTALHYAVNSQRLNVAQILLEKGADLMEVTKKGNSPLHTATAIKNLDLVKLLLEKVSHEKQTYFVNGRTSSTGTSSLHIAARDGSLQIVKTLLKYGANYKVRNKENKTPLDVAKEESVTNILRLINQFFEDCKNGNYDVIEKLQTLKQDELVAATAARNDDGCTLLLVCTRYKYNDIARKILELLKRK